MSLTENPPPSSSSSSLPPSPWVMPSSLQNAGYGGGPFTPMPARPPTLKPHVPARFFLGMIALYVLIVGLFALLESPLYQQVPSSSWFIPACAGGGFLLVSTLFLMIIGRGRTSGAALIVAALVVVALAILTTVCATGLALDLRGRAAYLDPLLRLLARPAWMLHDERQSPAATVIAGFALFAAEHLVILLPVFALALLGVLRTPQRAMFLAAVCGVAFNCVMSTAIGYGEFALENAPVTQYLLRFVNMSAAHAMWAAVGAGCLFFPAAARAGGSFGRPSIGRVIGAFVLVLLLRLFHDLLEVVHPATNVLTMLVLLAPMYGLARAGWRRASIAEMTALPPAPPPSTSSAAEPASPAPPRRRFILPWPSVALTIACALAALAYVVPPDLRQSLIALHGVNWLGFEIDSIHRVKDDASYAARRDAVAKWDESLLPPALRDARAIYLRAIDPFKQTREFDTLSGKTVASGALRLGANGVDENALDDAIAVPPPQIALNVARVRLNQFAAARGWPAPTSVAQHWRLTVWSVTPSAAATAYNELTDTLEPYLLVAIHRDDTKVIPFARSDVLSAAATATTPQPLTVLDVYAADEIPRLYLIDRDAMPGGSSGGELLDFLDLPPNALDGTLTLRHGTTVRLRLEYSRP